MITLEHTEAVQDDVLVEVEDFFKAIELPVNRRRRSVEGEKYNVIEWAIPATVTISIGALLLEGFIKEIGAGAGELFKGMVKRIYRKLPFGRKVYTKGEIDESLSKGTVPASGGHIPPVININVQIVSQTSGRDMYLPCVFPAGLSQQEVGDAVNSLVKQLGTIVAQQSHALDESEVKPLPLHYVYRANRGWVPDTVLIQELVERQQKKQKNPDDGKV
jgi:hypothetical protein